MVLYYTSERLLISGWCFMRHLLKVFWFEAIVNVIVVLLAIILPALYVEQFEISNSPAVVELAGRYYGVIFFVLTYILIRALLTKERKFICRVLETYLIGDIIQIWAALQLVNVIGEWNSLIIGGVALSVFYIPCRLLVLFNQEKVFAD